MFGFGWLSRLLSKWQESSAMLDSLKAQEKKELDEFHQAAQSGKLTGEQVSLCCESITIQLKKRGGDK